MRQLPGVTGDELQSAVMAAFESMVVETENGDVEVDEAMTFADAGLMTDNAGVLLRLANGQEVQVAFSGMSV